MALYRGVTTWLAYNLLSACSCRWLVEALPSEVHMHAVNTHKTMACPLLHGSCRDSCMWCGEYAQDRVLLTRSLRRWPRVCSYSTVVCGLSMLAMLLLG